MKIRCSSCDRYFHSDPRVSNQKYCGKDKCQKTRRRRWQREKRAADPVYRENQKAANRAWLDANPDYWKQYRKDHPKYTERNRKLQKKRNQAARKSRKKGAFLQSRIAKMDERFKFNPLKTGYYILFPVNDDLIANMGCFIVKIDVISAC